MDKQQQILEMAKDICRVKLNCNDVCNPISACDALKYAERAVEAGYSKQSEGEWVDSNNQRVGFNETDGCPEKSCYCSVCGEWLTGSDEYPCYGNFCPNCGAKMKGSDEK